MKTKQIIIFCFLLFNNANFLFSNSLYQKRIDSIPINQICGKWIWDDGNLDTFEIVLVKNNFIKSKRKEKDMNPLIIGWHSFIKDGKILESTLPFVTDTINKSTTIFVNINDSISQLLFHDLTRNRNFSGTLNFFLDNGVAKLIWSLIPNERIYFNESKIYPSGRTVPNNIVLVKTKS